MGKIELGEEDLREKWRRIEGRIGEALKEMDKELGNKKKKRKGWWDEECEWKKKRVREVLRGWRGKEGGKEDYRREKKEYKEMCERKKREENERWERRAEEATRESESVGNS